MMFPPLFLGGGGAPSFMTFVGTRTTQSSAEPVDYPTEHEGLSGDTLALTPNCPNRTVGNWGLSEEVVIGGAGDPGVGNRGSFEDIFVDRGERNVIPVLLLGTNDANTITINYAAYERWIRRMWAISQIGPGSIEHIVICQIPGKTDTTAQARIDQFNQVDIFVMESNLIADAIPVSICLLADGFDTPAMQNDGVHWNKAGCLTRARILYDHLNVRGLVTSSNKLMLVGDSLTEGGDTRVEGMTASYRPWLYQLILGNVYDVPVSPIALAGVRLWLNEQSLVTSGSEITGWTDFSGTNNHYTAAVGQRPVTGRTINGHAVADFPGTDERMTCSNAISTMISSTEYTVMIVAQPDVIDSNNASSFLNDGLISNAANTWRMNLRNNVGTITLNAGHADPTSRNTTAAGTVLGTTHLFQWRYDGTTIRSRVDTGVIASQGASAVVASALSSTSVLGANGTAVAFFDGAIAEVMVFTRSLDSWEVYQMRQYCGDRWGVDVTP